MFVVTLKFARSLSVGLSTNPLSHSLTHSLALSLIETTSTTVASTTTTTTTTNSGFKTSRNIFILFYSLKSPHINFLANVNVTFHISIFTPKRSWTRLLIILLHARCLTPVDLRTMLSSRRSASLSPHTLSYHILSASRVCVDPWKNAKVLKNSTCSESVFSENRISRTAAQARCDSDPKCLGLIWFNNFGANRVTGYKGYLNFGSDGRLVSEGRYVGCAGEIGSKTNNDWDVIVKPSKLATTSCVCVFVDLCVCITYPPTHTILFTHLCFFTAL